MADYGPRIEPAPFYVQSGKVEADGGRDDCDSSKPSITAESNEVHSEPIWNVPSGIKGTAKGILKHSAKPPPRFRNFRQWFFRLILRSRRGHSTIPKTHAPVLHNNRRDSEGKTVTISDSVCCVAYEVDSIELEERREHMKAIRSQRQYLREEHAAYGERVWFLGGRI